MFFRKKTVGGRTYLQIVESWRDEGRPRQRVIGTLGRLDELEANGQLAGLLASGARFTEQAMILNAHRQGEGTSSAPISIGPHLVFQRLWQETGCQAVIERLLADRAFEAPIERAIYLTVLHRLMAPGSDRAAEHWREAYEIPGTSSLALHHLYRAMAWLGEALSEEEQAGCTPFAPRTTKDLIEEALFQRRRDLFSELDLVFFDTTSIYFEGEGGQTLGARGHSKDSRPDLKQMVVGALLDGHGRPICCELWPGNTTDVKTLLPIVTRLKERFRIGRVCIVADRGMIDRSVLEALETDPERKADYILGARMRTCKEVRDEVLARPGRYREVHPERVTAKDPSPLKVKEVWVGSHRYIVCLNPEQARKDQADREAILASLREKLKQGPKAMVGNKGYRRYLKGEKNAFQIDVEATRKEARTDGKWVLRTSLDLSAEEVALRYKQLWTVEDLFRSAKTLLETRPIYHKQDETIRGHVFCSFLALVLRKELQDRLEARGFQNLEWSRIIQELDQLEETRIDQDGKRFALRSTATAVVSKVFQAVGVALPPILRRMDASVA